MHLFPALSLLLTLGFSAAVPAPALSERQNNGCSVGVTPARSAQIQAAFTSSGVVPTLIPSIQPRLEVSVNYNGKAVQLGNTFLTTETTTAPRLSFNAEPGFSPATTKYSYFLVDPDVPMQNGIVRTTFLHWFVSGAQPDCITNQTPRTVAVYQALTPASAEQHRYTFLVYREPAGYQPDIVTPQTRVGFNVNTYAARAGLVLVGGNFLREAITNGVVPTA